MGGSAAQRDVLLRLVLFAITTLSELDFAATRQHPISRAVIHLIEELIRKYPNGCYYKTAVQRVASE
jgi:hypothetical protein